MRSPVRLACLCALLAGSPAAAGSIVTTRYDELPLQPIDGLTFNGVTYHFHVDGVPSGDAFFNSTDGPAGGLPGAVALSDEHVILGSAFGVLEMDFASPVDYIRFAASIDTTDVVSPGVTVDLVGEDQAPVLFTGIETAPQPGGFIFAEAEFVYTGSPVVRMVLGFDATTGDCLGIPTSPYRGRCANGLFTVDNLALRSIPEPATASLLGLGAAALGLARRRRRAAGPPYPLRASKSRMNAARASQPSRGKAL